MAEDQDRPAGWVHHPRKAVVGPLDHAVSIGAALGEAPTTLHLVFTADGLYVPAIVRTPDGTGPFPCIVCLHGGSGGLGISYLLDDMLNRGWLYDRLHAEGYAVCVTEGRMEHEDAYGTNSCAMLDHDDVISVFRYLQRQPNLDPRRIGFFGASHGGELQMKVVSALGEGPAALVPAEPAVIEYLGLRYEGERKESNLQFNAPISDEHIDLASAIARIGRISALVPILVLGRDRDHLQGPHKKLFDLLIRAGKNAHWASWDHPEHAYQFGPRRDADGYHPDAVQQETLDKIVGFLNANVRDRP